MNEFILKLTTKVSTYLKSIIDNSTVNKELINLLIVYKKICVVISITRIDNRVIYKQTINQFKNLLIKFKPSRYVTTFALKSSTDKEITNKNFYTHFLLNCLTPLTEENLKTYNCVLGVYSIKGIVRRNKKRKSIAKQFTNNIFNLSYSTMNQLFDLFFYGKEYNRWNS